MDCQTNRIVKLSGIMYQVSCGVKGNSMNKYLVIFLKNSLFFGSTTISMAYRIKTFRQPGICAGIALSEMP